MYRHEGIPCFVLFCFSILNVNVEEEEKMRLLEDIIISAKEAYALAKTIN
ncbi:hypothetical protein [Priestia aryabhattai]|nr:hypothetical protein [Priestia aryabhattai]